MNSDQQHQQTPYQQHQQRLYQQQQQQQYRQQQHSHPHLLRQSLINLTSAHNIPNNIGVSNASEQSTTNNRNGTVAPSSSSLNYPNTNINVNRNPNTNTKTTNTTTNINTLHKFISCSCESLKCAASAVAAKTSKKRSIHSPGDPDSESLLDSQNADYTDYHNTYLSTGHTGHSAGCISSSISGGGGDDQRSLQSEYLSSHISGVSKQHSYDSSYSGQLHGLVLTARERNSDSEQQQQQQLDCIGNSTRVPNSPISCTNSNYSNQSNISAGTGTGAGGGGGGSGGGGGDVVREEDGGPSIICDAYKNYGQFATTNSNSARYGNDFTDDFKHIVVHNFSNSDPITRYNTVSGESGGGDGTTGINDTSDTHCSPLKPHYSDCNIYAKQQAEYFSNLKSDFDQNAQHGDKQQLVNKTYIFKCLANSSSFLRSNKIKEQSKKPRNLSLRNRTAKKKGQIISKSNAVSDNSLHPGDKYLNLYLVEKKNSQHHLQQYQYQRQQQLQKQFEQQKPQPRQLETSGSGTDSRPTVPSLQQQSLEQQPVVAALSRNLQQQQCLANGSVRTHPTYRHQSSIKRASKDYSATLTPTPSSHRSPKAVSNNHKSCNLKNNNKLSVSTNSCNKLHVAAAGTHPYATSPKSSLSSNGHLNKYCLTDISRRRKGAFNRQLSAPTDYTHSSNNGNGNSGSHSATEAACESTSTVASAGVGSATARTSVSLQNSVLIKPTSTSNSCTNSFNRRHIKRQKNNKINERYVYMRIQEHFITTSLHTYFHIYDKYACIFTKNFFIYTHIIYIIYTYNAYRKRQMEFIKYSLHLPMVMFISAFEYIPTYKYICR